MLIFCCCFAISIYVRIRIESVKEIGSTYLHRCGGGGPRRYQSEVNNLISPETRTVCRPRLHAENNRHWLNTCRTLRSTTKLSLLVTEIMKKANISVIRY